MTYNVHQLLHLLESVEKLGPLWNHYCFKFFFEDLNDDFGHLFHGTQNIGGQVTYLDSFLSIDTGKYLLIFLTLVIHDRC